MSRVRKGISYVIGDSTDNENHILPINAMQYSARRGQLFTGGRDGIVKVWGASATNGQGIELEPGLEQQGELAEGQGQGQAGQDDASTTSGGTSSEELLKLETAISSSPLPYKPIQNSYSVLRNYNLHFDWINDLLLVNGERDLVTCSSDLSLKLINLDAAAGSAGGGVDGTSNSSTSGPNSSTGDPGSISKFANVHTDYVKCLSSHNQTILSGGLDGKIVLWDLNTLSPTRIIDNADSLVTNSIYSLANNCLLVGCGGPSNTINLYDPRLQLPFVKKLIGHQDNVRCLVMGDFWALSGGSDCTIKLWDLRTFKMMKSFEVHEELVWCVAPGTTGEAGGAGAGAGPSFGPSSGPYGSSYAGGDSYAPSSFFSADKSGAVIKTDLSHLLLDDDDINDRLGVSTLVSKTDSPIIALGVEGNSIFVSDDTSLKRYHVPDTSLLSKYQYLRVCQEMDEQMEDEEKENEGDINSDLYDLVSHFSETSVLAQPYGQGQAGFGPGLGPEQAQQDEGEEYESMFLSVNGGASVEFVNFGPNGTEGTGGSRIVEPSEAGGASGPTGPGNGPNGPSGSGSSIAPTGPFGPNGVNETPVELPLTPPAQVSLIPFNHRPHQSHPLTPKSIIAKRLFNNKRWMLVLYLNGDITIWDIFLCRRIKTFPYNSSQAIVTSEMIKKRIQQMDNIFQEHQTTDTLNNWCEVEIKSGKLLVTLSETSFNNVEIYYDELVENYPFLAVEKDEEAKRNSKIKAGADDRLQLTRVLLNSVFHWYGLYEWEFDREVREALKAGAVLAPAGTGSGTSGASASGSGPSGASDALNRIKMFSKKSSSNILSRTSSRPNSTTASANASANASASASISDLPTQIDPVTDFLSQTTAPDDSITSLLLENRQKYVEKLGQSKKLPETALKIYSNNAEYNKNHLTSEEFIPYKPLIDLDQFPANLLIIIFENSPTLGNLRDVFSFRLNDLKGLNYESRTAENDKFVKELRNYLPKWIGNPVLYDKFPIKESPKIAFQLLELDYTNLDPNRKINGKSQRKIKRLPVLESSIKLTSHNMLRVSKILSYLTEKFESRTSEMKEKIPPTQWLVLECRGEELGNNMTLQTIKSKIWKSSSDIELRFRRRYD